MDTCVVEGPGVRSSVFDIFALVGYARLLAGPSEPVTRAASDGRGQRLEVTLRGVGWPLVLSGVGGATHHGRPESASGDT